jgi:hypothetical protein
MGYHGDKRSHGESPGSFGVLQYRSCFSGEEKRMILKRSRLATKVLVALLPIVYSATATAAPPVFKPFRLQLPTEEPVALAVLDSRTDVLNGERRESFSGFSRSLYGIPYPDHVPRKKPLADHIADHLERAFQIGAAPVEIIKVSPFKGSVGAIEQLRSSGAARLALLEIRDWWSDTLVHTDLHHDLKLTIFNREGEELGSATSIGHDELGKSNRPGRRDFMTAANDILSTLFADRPVVEAFSPQAAPLVGQPVGCTVAQILKMKEAGLIKEQIEAACGGSS